MKRIVVKVGTSTLTKGSGKLSRPVLVDLARQVAALREEQVDVVLVSSGAIAAGREVFGESGTPAGPVSRKQMLAAVGQGRLMHRWAQAFGVYDVPVGQVLLTRADVAARDRFLNARDTLQALLQHRIVPIVNENDAVATDEIKLGDNDTLSALVSLLVEADHLLLLTDQAGLFTADPRTNPQATLIEEVGEIDAAVRALAGGAGTGQGTGGMATKLTAADMARRGGARVMIASGATPDVLLRAAHGEAVGTVFPPLGTPLEQRKRWIMAGPPPAGIVHLDAGAADAMVRSGKSLLPAGMVRVEGSFKRGDTVKVEDPGGNEIGRGVVRYSADELTRLTGCHSDHIAERLGYTHGPVAIHRNDFVPR